MNPEPLTAVNAAGTVAATAGVAVSATPLLGTTADVLLVACAGALFGLAHTDPKLWARWLAIPEGGPMKRGLWVVLRIGGLAFTTAANAWVSAICPQVLPHMPLLGWTGAIAPQALAGVVAFGSQHLIPRALEAGKRWLDRRATA